MIGADAIIKCLEAEGVSTVFGYPGVAICPFFNSILDSDIKTVLIRTEQNAAHAASGVARMTGRPGVCAVTSGPGATNVITGIATAFADSIPMICITGQVNSELLNTYWNIGRIICEHEQSDPERADYGKQTIKELSKALTKEFGKGFSRSNLQNMR